MSFNELSKKIHNSFSTKKTSARYYKSEEDVSSLHSIISDLIESIDDIEYHFSYCQDEYEKIVLENSNLEQKINDIIQECNYMYPTTNPTVSLDVHKASDLFLALPKDTLFVNEYGLELVGTEMIGDPLQKHWIYNILNEKKWMLTKIKYAI